jgi:hypothetical protein
MDTDISTYNKFCRSLREGCILYNIDKTNSWGEYFLVANIASIRFAGQRTYSMMLLGLSKKEQGFVPRNLRIKLTPDYARNIPFLKNVGQCNFTLVPEIRDVDVNLGLVAVYGDVNLHKYAQKLSVHKPKSRKYGKDGHLVIKKAENEQH